MKAVWPDAFVEETNLTQNISTLRKTLGETTDGRSYIETFPKRGYRFSAVVTEVREEPPDIMEELPIPVAPEPTPEQAVQPSLRSRRIWAMLLVIPLLPGIYFTGRLLSSPRWNSNSEQWKIAPLTSYPGQQDAPTFSPDGRQAAFAWNGEDQKNFDIYVKLIGPGLPTRATLPDSDKDGGALVPDSAGQRPLIASRVTASSSIGRPRPSSVSWSIPWSTPNGCSAAIGVHQGEIALVAQEQFGGIGRFEGCPGQSPFGPILPRRPLWRRHSCLPPRLFGAPAPVPTAASPEMPRPAEAA